MWVSEVKPYGIDVPIWYTLKYMETIPAGAPVLVEELEMTDRIL